MPVPGPAGSHEIWFRESDNRYTTIPNHPGDMPEGTLRAILRQAGISVEAFLSQSSLSWFGSRQHSQPWRCRGLPIAHSDEGNWGGTTAPGAGLIAAAARSHQKGSQ
nr:type II toxin-antitoxin system HicA family toxin [Synechococcus sp. 1G10]